MWNKLWINLIAHNTKQQATVSLPRNKRVSAQSHTDFWKIKIVNISEIVVKLNARNTCNQACNKNSMIHRSDMVFVCSLHNIRAKLIALYVRFPFQKHTHTQNDLFFWVLFEAVACIIACCEQKQTNKTIPRNREDHFYFGYAFFCFFLFFTFLFFGKLRKCGTIITIYPGNEMCFWLLNVYFNKTQCTKKKK